MYQGNDGLFHIIEGAQVVVRKGAVFKQKKVYRRGRALFMNEAGGFVSLRKDGATGVPNVSWDYIEGVMYRPGENIFANLEAI